MRLSYINIMTGIKWGQPLDYQGTTVVNMLDQYGFSRGGYARYFSNTHWITIL